MEHSVTNLERIGVVVIGRNEGERLKRCLNSLPDRFPVVYVDSDSTDGSVVFAQSVGSIVITLDPDLAFTAARARNAGWRYLLERHPSIEFVQFIDGDCEVACEWFTPALEAMKAEATLAAVFGRRRERFPERSIYNEMCDDEWNVPVGIAVSCGGDALFRVTALTQAGGYTNDLIAGEEPDLCLRLGREGWHIRRIDAEMTVHDANILSLASWWKRAKRAGFAYAEHVRRHGSDAIPSWRRQVIRILFWSILLPATALASVAALTSFAPVMAPLALAVVLLIYLLQFLRVSWRKRRSGQTWRFALKYGALIMGGKFAEASGIFQCWFSHWARRPQKLIEYK